MPASPRERLGRSLARPSEAGLEEALDAARLARFRRSRRYQAFLAETIARKNAQRRQAVAVELAALRPLPRHRTTDFSVCTVSVTRFGTISVRGVLYTVPSRLVGCRLKVHVYDDRLVCYLGTTPVLTVARRYFRRNGPRQRVVDYRHLIGSLVKKPQAFRHSVFREALFPRPVFRRAWEALDRRLDPRKACRVYVGLLHLAAMHGCEARLAEHLEAVLAAGGSPISRRRAPPSPPVPTQIQRHGQGPDPAAYDGLLRMPIAAIRCHERRRQAAADAERVAAADHRPAMAGLCRPGRSGRLGRARFLAALCEHELAERAARRIARHLADPVCRPARRSHFRLRRRPACARRIWWRSRLAMPGSSRAPMC